MEPGYTYPASAPSLHLVHHQLQMHWLGDYKFTLCLTALARLPRGLQATSTVGCLGSKLNQHQAGCVEFYPQQQTQQRLWKWNMRSKLVITYIKQLSHIILNVIPSHQLSYRCISASQYCKKWIISGFNPLSIWG